LALLLYKLSKKWGTTIDNIKIKGEGVLAYIYRYQLRDSALKERTVLGEHAQILQSVLDEHFNKNLKDSIVEDEYFEFKLYGQSQGDCFKRWGVS
jgi:hypothetical protein